MRLRNEPETSPRIPDPVLRPGRDDRPTVALAKRPANVTQRIVTAGASDCASISRMARLRKHQRREHLCSCQSASPWQPEADEGEHRIGSPSLHRHRHGRRRPNCCAPSHRIRPCTTVILSTSPGKYQVLWRVDGFDFERAGRYAQAARNCLRWRSGLHRLQSCSSCTWIPESQVRSSSPCHRSSISAIQLHQPNDFRLPIAHLDVVLSLSAFA